jgi:hypothetical protein
LLEAFISFFDTTIGRFLIGISVLVGIWPIIRSILQTFRSLISLIKIGFRRWLKRYRYNLIKESFLCYKFAWYHDSIRQKEISRIIYLMMLMLGFVTIFVIFLSITDTFKIENPDLFTEINDRTAVLTLLVGMISAVSVSILTSAMWTLRTQMRHSLMRKLNKRRSSGRLVGAPQRTIQ